MVEFTYEGVDKSGKRVTGKLDVPTEVDLRMALRSQGVRPVRIGKTGVLNKDIGAILSGGRQRVPAEALVIFTRQMNLLITAGVPIVQGLEVLSDQMGHPALRSVLKVIKEKVSQGNYLWESLAAFPYVFPKIYIALIRAGEASGSLDQMLKRLSIYIENADRIRKIVKGAMMYPIIIICVGIGVIVLMMIFVIPKFEDLLKSGGQELPGLTKMVIDISHFIINNIYYLGGGTFAGIYLLMRYIRSPEGKGILDRVFFHLPLFGNIVVKSGVARFCRTMQTLLVAGVNLLDAIDICRATIDNAIIEPAVGKIKGGIEAGKSLGTALGELKLFPPLSIQMIMVGESTGNLDKMMEKIADFYEQEVEVLINSMTKLIEPIVLVVLGGIVGGLMIAMYLPVFKIAGSTGN